MLYVDPIYGYERLHAMPHLEIGTRRSQQQFDNKKKTQIIFWFHKWSVISYLYQNDHSFGTDMK